MGVSGGNIIRSVVDRVVEPCAGILFFRDAKRLGTNLLENSPQNRFFVAPVQQRRRTRLAAAAPKLPTTNTVSLANDLFLGGDDASSAVVIIVSGWLY